MRTTNIPPPRYTRRTYWYPPCFLHDKARHRRVDTSSYRNELISNSELQNSDSKTNLKSINPPSLKTSNNSRMLQTSTTLENHRQVKTTILFSKMASKILSILKIQTFLDQEKQTPYYSKTKTTENRSTCTPKSRYNHPHPEKRIKCSSENPCDNKKPCSRAALSRHLHADHPTRHEWSQTPP